MAPQQLASVQVLAMSSWLRMAVAAALVLGVATDCTQPLWSRTVSVALVTASAGCSVSSAAVGRGRCSGGMLFLINAGQSRRVY